MMLLIFLAVALLWCSPALLIFLAFRAFNRKRREATRVADEGEIADFNSQPR